MQFAVNGVISGWTEALQLMKPGAKWILYIPSELAYGEQMMRNSPIEPNSVLIFDIELISVEKQAPAENK
jgi:FKBP-type peptidyl-prolyl cis-trans isomerase